MNRNQDRYEHSEAKKIRDQAYTHLKEAVDEILETGRYVFRQDKSHLKKYASEYRRQIKSKQERKPKKKQQSDLKTNKSPDPDYSWFKKVPGEIYSIFSTTTKS